MRTPLLNASFLALRLVLILTLSGIPAIAQEAAQPAPPSSKPKLTLAKEGCAVQCNANPQCKAPQLKPEVCDYADTKGSFAKFDSLNTYQEQVKQIQDVSRDAATALSKCESNREKLLAETDPGKVDKTSPARAKKELEALKEKLKEGRKGACSDFLTGALQHSRVEVYDGPLEARAAALEQQHSLAKADSKKKMDASAAKMAAKTGDENGKIGQTRHAAAALQTGSDSQRSAASAAMFDGNARKGKAGPPAPSSSSNATQLGDSHSLAAGSMRGSYSDQYGSGHVRDMDLGHGASAPSAAGHSAPPGTFAEARLITGKENSYVKYVKGQQAELTSYGAQMQVGADQQSRLADQGKAAHDKAASSEWEKGNYFSAAWEKTKGVGSYAAHTAAEGAYKLEQGKTAVQNFGLDLARGDKKAWVYTGAAAGTAVAVVVTAGAAAPVIAAAGTAGVVSTTTAAAAGTMLLTGAGAGITTYGITQGGAKMVRAESKTEFAVGGAEVAVNALAGPIVKGAGRVAGVGMEAVGLGKQATAVAEFFGHGTAHAAEATAGKAAVEIAASQTEKVAARIAFGQAEQHLVTHSITHVAEHAVVSGVETAGESLEGHHRDEHAAMGILSAPRGAH